MMESKIEYKVSPNQDPNKVLRRVVDLVEDQGYPVQFDLEGKTWVAVPIKLWEELREAIGVVTDNIGMDNQKGDKS